MCIKPADGCLPSVVHHADALDPGWQPGGSSPGVLHRQPTRNTGTLEKVQSKTKQ